MKCKKCGNRIPKGDMFCQNCGWKVEKYDDISKENIDFTTKKKKRKIFMIIAGIAIASIIALIAIISIFIIPKDVEIEAGDLAALINEGKADKYYSDNLYVHGYLIRDTRKLSTNEKDSFYILVSDIENWEQSAETLVFSYKEGLEDNLGTGTEIVVHGRLQDDSNDSMNMLIGENIEIKRIVDPIYTLDFEQINTTDYIDKQVQISGRMIDFLGQGHYLIDDAFNYSVELKGLTEAEFASYFKNGSYVTITGTLTNENVIKVNEILQDEFTKEMSYDYGISISECYNSYLSQGDQVTIHGLYIKNGSYSVPYAIMDEQTGQFISLSVFTESVDLDKYFASEEQCVITGYLSEGGTGYILEVIAIG